MNAFVKVMVNNSSIETLHDDHPSGEQVLVGTGNGSVYLSESQIDDLYRALGIWKAATNAV